MIVALMRIRNKTICSMQLAYPCPILRHFLLISAPHALMILADSRKQRPLLIYRLATFICNQMLRNDIQQESSHHLPPS